MARMYGSGTKVREPTRKQLNNLKGRKDPNKLAKSTKIHDVKHEYKRNHPTICGICYNEVLFCECNEED